MEVNNIVNKYKVPIENGFYLMYLSDKIRINVFVNKAPIVYFVKCGDNILYLYVKSSDIKVKCDSFYEIYKINKDEVNIKWETQEYGVCSIVLNKITGVLSNNFIFNMSKLDAVVNSYSVKLSNIEEGLYKEHTVKNDNQHKIIPISTDEVWQIGEELITSDEMNERMKS